MLRNLTQKWSEGTAYCEILFYSPDKRANRPSGIAPREPAALVRLGDLSGLGQRAICTSPDEPKDA